MELLEGTKRNITKDKNWENVPHFENTEVILAYFNIVNDD